MVSKYCRDLLSQICTPNPTGRSKEVVTSSSSTTCARQHRRQVRALAMREKTIDDKRHPQNSAALREVPLQSTLAQE